MSTPYKSNMVSNMDPSKWPWDLTFKVKFQGQVDFFAFLAKFRFWTHANYCKMARIEFLKNEKWSIGFFLSKMIFSMYVCHTLTEQRAFAFLSSPGKAWICAFMGNESCKYQKMSYQGNLWSDLNQISVYSGGSVLNLGTHNVYLVLGTTIPGEP